MRRVIIVAATGVIALAQLLVTPIAHADECDSLPAQYQPGCRAKFGEPPQADQPPGGSPNNGQAYVPGVAGNGPQIAAGGPNDPNDQLFPRTNMGPAPAQVPIVPIIPQAPPQQPWQPSQYPGGPPLNPTG
jgi:hypothetical protein